ncbi:hypothetical protein [Streptomyces resistomycificus]|uniref:hypothetical protein n=1 Tax=Streptomyces resistomycificus TaxID=67356 RepID=UPI000B0285AC|nr:hypothetical protein [Streptomyces resistomycificus]
MLFLALVAAGDFAPGPLAPQDGHVEGLFVPLVAALVLLLSTRRTAVRVGPAGITLRRAAFLGRREVLPWSAIASVALVLTPRAESTLTVLWRGTDTPPPDLPASPALRELDTYLDTQVEPDFVAAFRGTTMTTVGMDLCKVDPVRLRTALRTFAPDVRLFGDLASQGSQGHQDS